MKWLWVSVAVVLLDQFSKLWADSALELHRSIELIPSLAIRKVYNSGAAFSFLGNASGWQRWFFIALALLVVIVLTVWLYRLQKNQLRMALALSLVLGGAVGNLIDRVLYGYVIDFIDVYYASWHWPTFNVADSAITVGAALLLLDAFTSHKKDEANRACEALLQWQINTCRNASQARLINELLQMYLRLMRSSYPRCL
jgi:signal peptidase II